ncbi:MAG TPA: hypothetical protein VHY84_18625 [Bryobacteraceae bacterium]|jgi:hypothetical protein|nr:hypothetical protein [Bryobacteraceae bacterium]
MLIATGQMEKPEQPPEKDEKAVSSGRMGGVKGGRARADKLTPEKRADCEKGRGEKLGRSLPQPGGFNSSFSYIVRKIQDKLKLRNLAPV